MNRITRLALGVLPAKAAGIVITYQPDFTLTITSFKNNTHTCPSQIYKAKTEHRWSLGQPATKAQISHCKRLLK